MPRDEGSDRRRFLKAASVAGAAAAAGASGRWARAQEDAAPAGEEGAEITLASLVEAEKVAGVRFTDAERRQMLPSVRRQAEAARELVLPHPDLAGEAPPTDDPHPAWSGGHGPAEVFDPRLPGMQLARDVRPAKHRIAAPRLLPSSEEEIAYASLADLSRWVKGRALSSADLTDLYLRRLKALDETLECVITLCEERARAAAARADEELAAGRWRGPLHGLPWGAKDLLDTRGVLTTWGAAPFARRVPDRDATVVRRLDEAGAVLIAKLSLGALAYGDRWFGGTTRNPFRPSQGSSGSSAGSAAAAVAGGVAFALGTETYGSIGSPCARCGATGFRPTFGRVSRAGAMTLCWSLDKVGPIARSADDCALVLDAIAGPDDADPATVDVPLNLDQTAALEGLRVGVVGDGADDDVVVQALLDLGARTRPVEPPDGDHGRLIFLHIAVEAAAAFDELTRGGLDDAMVWQDEPAWPNTFRAARLFPAVQYLQARRERRRLMVETARAFEGVDVVVDTRGRRSNLTALTNLTGHPAVTIRRGFREDGTPRAAHLWAGLYEDAMLLNVAAAVERELGLLGRRPEVG